MRHTPSVGRRQFIQLATAAVALGGTTTAEDGTADAGFGAGGFGDAGFGGGTPFSDPIGHAVAAPTDPDGDGLYEDVDGDGRLSVADVQTLIAFRSSSTAQDNADLLDFDGDGGDTDVDDARALFEEFVDGIEQP